MTDPRRIVEDAKAALMGAVRTKAKAAALELLESIPTRTGRSRASFLAAINHMPSGTDPRVRGAPVEPSGAAALDRIEATIDRLKPGDVLVVNSDYRNATRYEEAVSAVAEGWTDAR